MPTWWTVEQRVAPGQSGANTNCLPPWSLRYYRAPSWKSSILKKKKKEEEDYDNNNDDDDNIPEICLFAPNLATNSGKEPPRSAMVLYAVRTHSRT